MSLSCSCGEWEGEGVAWEAPDDYTALTTRRRQRCRSCNSLIEIGAICTAFKRLRQPNGDVEIAIYGDCVVYLAPHYLCEACSDIYFSLEELGYCPSLEDNMRAMATEYGDLCRFLEKKAKAE